MKCSFNLVFLLFFACSDGLSQNREKPNVLIISVDDMRDWVGYLQGYEGTVHTPNIDRLANDGVGFTNAHTAATLCCPSRNAFFLGKRPSTTGLYTNGHWWKPAFPDEIPLPQYFKQHGYYVAGAGKNFHDTPGNNPPCSWDDYQDFVFDSPWNYANWDVERYAVQYGFRGPIQANPDFIPLNDMLPINSPFDWGSIPDKPEEAYGDAVAANYACEFLREEHDKPFFLSIGIFRPHLPWYVPQEYFDMYPLDEIALPEVKENDTDDLPSAGKKMASSRYFTKLKAEGKWKEAIRAYLASISFADTQVGVIYDALMKSNYAENTIVVFWSDHGWHLGSKGHWQKSTLWEDCTRIPFVMKVPGVTQRGILCTQPVDMVNVYPTLVSLCGLPPKGDLDGRDMSTLLESPAADWPWPAITQVGVGNTAVRSRDWRLIRYANGDEEFYDRNADPREWVNLAGHKKYEALMQEHRHWIPNEFEPPQPVKAAYFFDPAAYSWLVKETKAYITGDK